MVKYLVEIDEDWKTIYAKSTLAEVRTYSVKARQQFWPWTTPTQLAIL